MEQEQPQSPDTPLSVTLFAGLSDIELIRELWNHFPENMFLVRVESEDDFIMEAVNPAQKATLGAACEGRRLHDFLPRDTADAIWARYHECVVSDMPMRYQESATYFDPEGVECFGHWLTLLVPIHHHSHRVTHLFGISQDLTELQLAREALERQNQRLEARVAERTAELRAANDELQSLNARLEELATRDFLTSAYNRRHLESLAESELRRVDRSGAPLCMLMIDLDEFKQVNDALGHAAGDAVLRRVADTLRAELRDSDLLGRYGGDEFVIVLPDTRLEEALATAERLRHAVQASTQTTISLGVAQYQPGDIHLGELTQRADHQLLDAKRDGRNRIGIESM
ncbi:sensor domain-containing diguanylate cyclase [Billgrantia endophytica]|uniref:diguanylate cyclase n=1 Tax=Billgrantia endophytica TaxID=2033802 RepID=A0A2N7U432_9GAMM|nr:sensor domain-containing diguanylate cyclase [Halomonas endophytica]PMR75183.1 hypothetical protein C1H69_10910 [Halomonas endophytica]